MKTINPEGKYAFQLVKKSTGGRSPVIGVTPKQMCALLSASYEDPDEFYVLFLFAESDLDDAYADVDLSDLFMYNPVVNGKTFIATYGEQPHE